MPIQRVTLSREDETHSSPILLPVAHSSHPWSRTFPAARSMPVEIVSDIFNFVTHSSPSPISSSISVSHVSKQWRQISLSMSSLWTSIMLLHPLSESQIMRTITLLIRSRNRPVDIYMDFRDPSWDWDEESHVFGPKDMEDVMRLLVPHASRWKSIQLLTDTWAPLFTFLSHTVAVDSAPLLQTISLARCNEYFVAPGEVFRPRRLVSPIAWFQAGTSLTCLRHVSLSGVHIDWVRSGLSGLRELELKYHAHDVMPILSDFRSMLCANPGLERLVILGWGPRMSSILDGDGTPGDDDLQTINLPRLKEFEIGFVDVTCTVKLLSLFTLPSLHILTIEDIVFEIQRERQDCSLLLDHLVEMDGTDRVSLPRLSTLSLRGVYANPTSICNMFRRLRALKSLYLDHVHTTTLLAACSALGGACDWLQALTLKDVDTTAVAHLLSSVLFPSRTRIFLDIDGTDGVAEEDGKA